MCDSVVVELLNARMAEVRRDVSERLAAHELLGHGAHEHTHDGYAAVAHEHEHSHAEVIAAVEAAEEAAEDAEEAIEEAAEDAEEEVEEEVEEVPLADTPPDIETPSDEIEPEHTHLLNRRIG